MSWKGLMRKAGFGSFGVGNTMDYRGNFTADNIIGFPRKYLYVSGNNGTLGATGTRATNACLTIQEAVDIANTYENLGEDTDIFVAGGFYEETVAITRSACNGGASGADTGPMLWTAGGTNVGQVGKIRIIPTGYAFLQSPAAALSPTIYFGRPNVEVHNFATIKCGATGAHTKGLWVDVDGGTSVHMTMPTVLFSDDYNMGAAGGDTLDYGAANACLINNCKVNGGHGGGGILNNGGNWNHATNCLVEYYTEYGIAHVGSSKGTAAENLTRSCNFHQQGANSPALVHGQAVIWWVDDCRFWDESPSGGLLHREASNSNSSFCWITNSQVHDEADLDETNNGGWDAVNITSASGGGPMCSDNLTTASWVTAANVT